MSSLVNTFGVLLIIFFLRFRIKWIHFKNFILKDEKNINIHSDINQMKLIVTKDFFIVKLKIYAKHYTRDDDLRELIGALPRLLEREFKVHFDDDIKDDLATYTAIRQPNKLWRWARSVYANAINRHRRK